MCAPRGTGLFPQVDGAIYTPRPHWLDGSSQPVPPVTDSLPCPCAVHIHVTWRRLELGCLLREASPDCLSLGFGAHEGVLKLSLRGWHCAPGQVVTGTATSHIRGAAGQESWPLFPIQPPVMCLGPPGWSLWSSHSCWGCLGEADGRPLPLPAQSPGVGTGRVPPVLPQHLGRARAPASDTWEEIRAVAF